MHSNILLKHLLLSFCFVHVLVKVNLLFAIVILSYHNNGLLEVVVTTTFIQFAFVVLHSRGGSWELVDAFSLCCLTWHFWKILAA